MRIFLAAILCSAATAAAEPQLKCFDGTETVKLNGVERTFHAVMKRTTDPAASTIHQQAWTEKDPTKERSIVYKVDVKTNTFEADDSDLGAKGKGTLVGKPWAWTSYTLKVNAKGVDFETTGDLTGDAVNSHGTLSKGGKQIGTIEAKGTTFDCAKLEEHRAALAKKP